MSMQRSAPQRGGAAEAPRDQLEPRRASDHDMDAPKQGAIGHLSADEELQQAVCSALIELSELDASDIAVRAANARVVLSGTVRSDAERRLALRIASAHAGQGAVEGDELRVRGDQRA